MTEAARPGDAPGAALMPRWPKRPQRLATAVVSDLADRIVAGEFPVGAPLPVEAVLCERYAVSRTTVREAVKALESMRVVEVRQGSGTTVRASAEWNILDPTILAALVANDEGLEILDEIIDLRCQLESSMAAKAAKRLTAEHRSVLTRLLREMDAATGDPDLYLDLDVTFHEVIMNASGSRLSQAFIGTLNRQAYGSGSYIGNPTDADRKKSNAGHHRIYAALAGADREGVAAAMTEHIYQAWRRRRPRRPARR